MTPEKYKIFLTLTSIEHWQIFIFFVGENVQYWNIKYDIFINMYVYPELILCHANAVGSCTQ